MRILNAQNRRHCSVPPSTISLKKLKSLLRVLTAFTHFFTVTTYAQQDKMTHFVEKALDSRNAELRHRPMIILFTANEITFVDGE